MGDVEQEERAKLWFWIEYMEWELDPETVEQMVRMAVQSRQIQSVMDCVNQYTVNTHTDN